MESNPSPRLSMGLPVYNGERYLEEALESLVQQTYTDFELIISDNASSDRTQEICERFARQDNRIVYIRNRENIGAAQNFNQVVGMAHGEYFKWVAHDDRIEPNFLKKCIAVLDADRSIGLVYSKSTRIDENGMVTGAYDYPMRVDSPAPHVRFQDLILVNHFCIAVFGVMRKSILIDTPLIAPFVGSDRTLLAEFGLRTRLCEIQEYLFNRRDHPQTSGRMYQIYNRLSWFDPKKIRSLYLPHWRVGIEYWRTVLRVPLPLGERIQCLGIVLVWFLNKRRLLREDFKAVILQLFPFINNISGLFKRFTRRKKQGGYL